MIHSLAFEGCTNHEDGAVGRLWSSGEAASFSWKIFRPKPTLGSVLSRRNKATKANVRK